MAKRPRKLSSAATAAVVRLREASALLPHVVETLTFGNPTFKVHQKAFAVLDRYSERDCLWLRVDPHDRENLLMQSGWFPSPYDPKCVALCCALEQFDWRRLKPLLRRSYDLALSGARKVAK